jgi:predicted transcriptional regulator
MLIAMEAAAVSPTQFATEFDLPLGSVSYHVSVLLKVGCVEIVKRIPRQGSIEHFYRSTARGKKLLAGLAGI